MSRTSRLNQNPDLRAQFAESYADGATRAELAATFGVHEDTITRWTKDSQIQALVSKLREERVNRITRKIDARLEGVVNDPKVAKDPKLLLEIRKTLAPAAQTSKVEHSGSVKPGDAEADLWRKLNENPELAAKLFGESMVQAAANSADSGE